MDNGPKIDSPSIPTGSIGARSGPHRKPAIVPAWIRSNRFILGLFGVVILAFLFPEPGARNGWLHPDLISDFGIALILFLQGLSIPLEKVRRGAGNWRLRRFSVCDYFAANLSHFASCQTEPRRLDCCVLLFGKKNFGDGCTPGVADFDH